MLKKQKHTIGLLLAFIISIAIYIWFAQSPYFNVMEIWVRKNTLLFFVSLVILKILGTVWPPIPGGIFTLGSIPFLGWESAYAADFIGSIVGSTLAYYLGKRYGESFLLAILDKDVIEKIKKVKIKKEREIEAIFTLKFLTGSILLEAISYVAGLLKINFTNFILGSILSHLIIGIPTYYFANNIISGRSIIFTVISIIGAIILFMKFKGRYLE